MMVAHLWPTTHTILLVFASRIFCKVDANSLPRSVQHLRREASLNHGQSSVPERAKRQKRNALGRDNERKGKGGGSPGFGGLIFSQSASPASEKLESLETCTETSGVECEIVGCFRRVHDDISSLAQLSTLTSEYDLTCVDYTPAPGPCKSGLPFYSFVSNDLSPTTCLHFCMSKGLDLAGLVGGMECRCGASRRLKGVWVGSKGGSEYPPIHLLFEFMERHRVPETSSECKIAVYRYNGPVIEGELPQSIVRLNRADERYISRIVTSKADEWDRAAALTYLAEEEIVPFGAVFNSTSTYIGEANSTVANHSLDPDADTGSELLQGSRVENDNSASEEATTSAFGDSSSAVANSSADHFLLCVDLREEAECSESHCSCSEGFVKQTLMLASGAECWACAPHCNSNAEGCGQLPCRCDSSKGEVAAAWNSTDSATPSCIRCLSGNVNTNEPWPAPKPHSPKNRIVWIPYLLEDLPSKYSLNAPRLNVVADAISEFENAFPCIKFRLIKWRRRLDDDAYRKGHYLRILKPPDDQSWCFAQNTGNRRRATSPPPKLGFEEDQHDLLFRLGSGSSEGWEGPTLLWLGHCNAGHWMPRVLEELGRVLGLRSGLERVDARRTWSDPWSKGPPVEHQPHIEVFWHNIVNESAKVRFLPNNDSYTGSFDQGIMDAHSGYADYDFFSLMHPDTGVSSVDFRKKASFRTLPNGNLDSAVGNARFFSQKDFRTLADLYQCNTDRFFVQQGYRVGQSLTSIDYGGLSHVVTSEMTSTQEWIASKDSQNVEDWIETKMLEKKWQLSFIRYMPSDAAFTAYVDTNRWSRRRQEGVSDQRYHWGTNISKFKEWLRQGHRDRYLLTDISMTDTHSMGIMTRMPGKSTRQTIIWSSNFSYVVEQIELHASMPSPYAVTNLVQHTYWDSLGSGCCVGLGRDDNHIYEGGNMDIDECKSKCREYKDCGTINLFSWASGASDDEDETKTTSFCHIYSNQYECSSLDEACSEKSVPWDMSEYSDNQGGRYEDVCLGRMWQYKWFGTEEEAKTRCLADRHCAGIWDQANDGRSWRYCTEKPRHELAEQWESTAMDLWRPKPPRVTTSSAHGHQTEWVLTLTTDTSITAQMIKVADTEPEAIEFINAAYANRTTPARLTSLTSTHSGGFVIIMSATTADQGPPYWTPPTERLQRYTMNQPYSGFI